MSLDPAFVGYINSLTEEVEVNDVDAVNEFIEAADEDNEANKDYDILMLGGAKDTPIETVPSVDDRQIIDDGLDTINLTTLPIAELTGRGMVAHHISSMNTFLETGLKQIVEYLYSLKIPIQNTRTNTLEDQSINFIDVSVKYSDVRVSPPTTFSATGQAQKLTPTFARIAQETLRNPIHVTVKVTAVATTKKGETITREETIPDLFVGCIPTIVRTQGCHTGVADRETLKQLQEDPRDPGGYGIFSGLERAFDSPENIANNMPHIHKVEYKNEVCRVDFISKPGDSFENSARCLIRLYANGSITVELTTGKFEKLEIPFYIMFRALGETSDLNIVDSIMFGVHRDDRVACLIRECLLRAFEAPEDLFAPIRKNTVPTEVVQFIAQSIVKLANPAAARKEDEILKFMNASVLELIDKYFFPHIGLAEKDRAKKLRYFGLLINKMLLVHLGITEPTNRDDYKGKRVLPAGIAMAKSVKQQWNFAVGQPMKQGLIKAFKATSFSEVNLRETVIHSINDSDLLDLLSKSVTSGSGTVTIKRREVKSHITSQQLIRKNDVAVFSVLRTFSITNLGVSKQTERAEQMRLVDPSQEPFADTAQSPETVAVGTVKQMNIATSISEACSSGVLKDTILRDKDVIPFDDVLPGDIYARKLSFVFVQGDVIGFVENTALMRDKYIKLRREGKLNNRTITIEWSPVAREIHFWTDVGRPLFPLVIVYNNLPEYKAARLAGKPIEFRQWIRLTSDHIRGLQTADVNKKITMADLERQGVIEYVAPGEIRNAYVAMNIDKLREAKNNVCFRYTHMGIEQACLGIVSHCSPFNNHASATRNTYFTCQRKSGIAWPFLNYPYRIDKLVPMQHTPQRALLSTLASSLVLPTGYNAICMLILGDGSTQEDSLGVNQNAVDTGMFHVSLYSSEKVELDPGELLGNPHPTKTLDVKKDADYSHLVDNKYVKVGTKAVAGTVLVNKVAKLPSVTGVKGEDFLYGDRSVVARKEEPVWIERVIPLPSADNATKVLIKTRENMPLSRGDKAFSRTGNKGIVSSLRPRIDLPFSNTGLIPDIICSAHSMPTRMASNQKMEMMLGQQALKRGAFHDATAFCPPPDLDKMAQNSPADLEAFLKDPTRGTFKGCRRMYNGITGLPYDMLLFVGPSMYLRHNKFIDHNKYAIFTGPSDPGTKQPRDGKNNQGGIKIGEMEKNSKYIHGTMGSLYEKLFNDSDGCELYICAVCGKKAVVNKKSSLYYCKRCEDNADIRVVDSSWSSNLFIGECESMGVHAHFDLTPHSWPM